MTQGEIAERLGLHRPAITECEAGRRRVSAVELYTWATALGTTPAAIYRLALAAELGSLAFSLLDPQLRLWR